MSEGPAPGLSLAGPGPSDTSVSYRGAAPAPRGERVASSSARRTYVLDTSVLLADPAAIGRFAEHRVVLPVVVITELEAKRHHPELGYFARQALRYLADLRVEYGRRVAHPPGRAERGPGPAELNQPSPSAL